MIAIWRKGRQFEPLTETDVRKDPLWFNRQIGPATSYIHWKNWQEKGVETIGDICHDTEPRLLSHNEITAKFHIPCTFLEALSLRANIPSRWRNILTADWQPGNSGLGIDLKLDDDPPEDTEILSPKRMYAKLVTNSQKINTAFHRWREGDDGIQISDYSEWTEACRRAKLSIQNSEQTPPLQDLFKTTKDFRFRPMRCLQKQGHHCPLSLHMYQDSSLLGPHF